jgi:MoaA/NifB/PqqE/SkfB family radical SAM enzyme
MEKPIDSLMLIDLMVTELCNRECEFCPRSEGYPNLNLHMSLDVVKKIANDLKKINYKHRILFCGFGEPLLYKNLTESIEILRESLPNNQYIQMVTNGDKLTRKKIDELYNAGLNKIYVSLYDGEEQIDIFNKMFKGIDTEKYFFHHYYKTYEENYGFLHYSNRSGAMYKGKKKGSCNIPFYTMTINYLGKTILCSHDWSKQHYFGDVMKDTIEDVWLRNKKMIEYRKMLTEGNRCLSPCTNCNVDGKFYGDNSRRLLNESQ